MTGLQMIANGLDRNNTVQLYSTENQKGSITIDFVYSDSILLVLNGTSLSSINALLALNSWYSISTVLKPK